MRERYGPWALVVGASDGIGAAFAEQLAATGLNLVLVARREGPLQELAARLPTQTLTVAADAGTPEGLAAIEAVTEDVGLVVVNAALAPIGEFLNLTAAQHAAMVDLNCRCASQLAYAYGHRLKQRGKGGLILLSSLASNQGAALVAHYSATKAYLRVLAEGLWEEWGPLGIDVVACCPGTVATPTYLRDKPKEQWLVGRAMDPADVARDALHGLGRGPVVIPGWRNRLSATLMKTLPRRTLVKLTSSQTRATFPGSSRPGTA